MKKVLVLHGPNLNLLGTREPELYGSLNLTSLNKNLVDEAKKLNIELTTKQTNSEGTFVDYIHAAYNDNVDLIIVNPAAYTHTSIAISDALIAVKIPFIEVHISNIYAREKYRHTSFISANAEGVITGFGTHGYHLALSAAHKILNHREF